MKKNVSSINYIGHFCAYKNKVEISTVLISTVITMLALTFVAASSVHAAYAVTYGLLIYDPLDESSQEPQLQAISNNLTAGNPINPPFLNRDDPVVQDALSRLTLTSLNRTNGEDRVLTPVYQFTQTLFDSSSDYRVIHYVWREPQHYDLEAVVGVKPVGNQYHIEIGKLSDKAIKVDLGSNQSGVIPATNSTSRVSLGYVTFEIPR